jgi:tetratricopeptide (TPR) repeat protein
MEEQPDITLIEDQAIHAALNSNWEKAIELNLEIIDLLPKNIAALNRLSIAYIKTSQPQLARKTLNKVLKITPTNHIALRNLLNIKHLAKTTSLNTSARPKTTLVSFIEEPGISRIVPLIKPGSPQVIANLTIGQVVVLKSSERRIKIFTQDTKEYIGRLPDNVSLTLGKLIKQAYKYQVFIKSINPQFPQVFIQETKRPKKLSGIPSFPVKDNQKTAEISDSQPTVHPLEIFDPLASED